MALVKKGSAVEEAPQDSTVIPLGKVGHDSELDESPLVHPELDAADAATDSDQTADNPGADDAPTESAPWSQLRWPRLLRSPPY